MNIRSHLAFSAFTSRPNSTLLTDKVSVSLFGERMSGLIHCLDDRGIGIRYHSLYRQEMSLDSNAYRWAFWTMGTWWGVRMDGAWSRKFKDPKVLGTPPYEF